MRWTFALVLAVLREGLAFGGIHDEPRRSGDTGCRSAEPHDGHGRSERAEHDDEEGRRVHHSRG